MNEQTWTDEQLRECLDTLSEQIHNGNNPTFCLHQVPDRFPWCGTRYILQHENDVIALSLPQAYQVEAWLNQHTTANPPAREKHDGKLGDGQYSASQVNYDEVHDAEKQRYIEGIRIADEYGYAPLTPKQALSLLAWLKQEEATLEQLMKEQTKGNE